MSVGRLEWGEFVPYAPSKIGETVTVEHCRPDRKKLYVTRYSNRIVANCYNCSHSGVYFVDPPIYAEIVEKPSKYKKKPTDLISLEDRKPNWVKSWIKPSELSGDVLSERYGFSYSPSKDFCYVNLSRSSHQERRKVAPKAVTRKHPSVPANNSVWYETYPLLYDSVDTIVIVEDPLSAAKLDYFCNTSSRWITAVSLLGVTIHNDLINMIIERNTKHIIVWLDNDNRDVIKQAEKIYRKFDLCIDRVSLVSEPPDPKHVPSTNLIAWSKTIC